MKIFNREGGFIRSLQGLISIGLIVGGIAGAFLLVALRSPPPKAEVRRSAALVGVVQAEPRPAQRRVVGYGTAEAARRIELRPLVSGEVVYVHPKLEVGGRIASGEELVRVDPRDYEIALENARAELVQAEFEYKLEQGNQVVAKREWSLLEKDIQSSELGEELVLRKPHLKAKQAAVNAARSRVKKAELDLERTKIFSPFDAVVLSESVEVGKYLSPQNPFAELASVDAFYVRVRVPRSDIEWLDATAGERAAEAKVVQDLGAGKAEEWSARFVRLLGDVEEAGRMAQLLVAVDNPLEARKPLLLGSYVRAELAGKTADNVYKIPQRALREGSVIWHVTPESKLAVSPVEVVFTQGEDVYVKGDLPPAVRVVTSSIEGALRGMLVEVAAPGARPEGDNEQS